MLDCYKLYRNHVVIQDGFLEKYGVELINVFINMSCTWAVIFGFYDDVKILM